MPTYNIFGWQKPCYLLQDGYADTFEELMADDEVGELRHGERQSESARTAWCTAGTRPSAVNDTFGSLKGLLETAQRNTLQSL